MTTVTYRGVLSGDKPFKSLLKTKKDRAGRNNAGRITTPVTREEATSVVSAMLISHTTR